MAQLIKLKDVEKKISRSRSSIYRLMNSDETFPKPIKLSDERTATVFFLESAVDQWISAQSAQSYPDNQHTTAS